MTKRDVFSLAVKIVGIWTMIMGIISIPGMFAIVELPKSSYLGISSQLIAILLYVGPILTILVGAILLFQSDSISSHVIKNDVSFSLPEWLTDKNEVFQFALAITGLILVTTNLPNLIYAFYTVFHSMASDGLRLGNAFELNFAHIRVFQAITGVAIGAFLLFSKRSAGVFLRGEKQNGK